MTGSGLRSAAWRDPGASSRSLARSHSRRGVRRSDADPVDLARAQATIRTRAQEAFGADATIGRVRCPGKVEQEQGASFGCTVEVDGQALPYVVRLTNDSGGMRVESVASLLVTQKVEQFIADYAADNDEQVQSVDCGSTKYLVRARGTKVSCSVVRGRREHDPRRRRGPGHEGQHRAHQLRPDEGRRLTRA